MFRLMKKMFSILLYDETHVELKETNDDIFEDETEEKENPIYDSTDICDLTAIYDYTNENVSACNWKQGVITFYSENYGLIDNYLYFQPHVVSGSYDLKIGDLVSYMSYRAQKNENERVVKVKIVSEVSWENEDTHETKAVNENISWDENVECDVQTNLPCLNENIVAVESIERILTGKVAHIRGKEIMVVPINVWCNLDNMETEFNPIEGDWVSLKAQVSVDLDVINLAGEILDIEKIKPLLVREGQGTITFLQKNKKYSVNGIIENEIGFSDKYCSFDFSPSLGDQVIYKAIESDQGRLKWRALYISKVGESENKKYISSDEMLMACKNGIVITGETDFGLLKISDTKLLTINLENKGTEAQTFLKGEFLSNTNQVKLKSPYFKDGIVIQPCQTIKFTFVCDAKYLGANRELFIFIFQDFQIGKYFHFDVTVNEKNDKLFPCNNITKIRKKSVSYTWKSFDHSEALYGAAQRCLSRFHKEIKKGVYKIPQQLFKILVEESNDCRDVKKVVEKLKEYAPFIKDELNAKNYQRRFHTLLYVEEIFNIISWRRYEMKNVILRKKKEFLSLDISNVVCGTEVFVINSKVIVTQPWSEINSVEQIGYIHHIFKDELLIKFHDSFHENYDESDCNVNFEPSRTSFIRRHAAVDRAFENLGTFWLFPQNAKEKPPLVSLRKENNSNNSIKGSENIVDDNVNDDNNLICDDFNKTAHNCDVDENRYKMPPERKLQAGSSFNLVKNDKTLENCNIKWFNERLNYLQKLAVLNVLESRTRPMPYVIYGPPGTGKTITLTEIVLQICHLISDSRILIATASNSSADLICSYLIDTGQFTPGELVRLLSFNRAMCANIPEKLIPYCATVQEERMVSNTNLYDTYSNIRMFEKDAMCMQKVIISTCSASGVLHNVILKKGHFSHIIIDEACQTIEPEVLIPISFLNPKRGNVILCGDPEQLRAVSMNDVSYSFGYCKSLLERFLDMSFYAKSKVNFLLSDGYDPRFITRLRINYRSVPEILNLPSKLFYDSELIPVVSQTKGIEAEIIDKFNLKINLRTPPPAIIFHCICGQNYKEDVSTSWYNPLEVWQTVTYLKKLYAIGLSPNDIGIITPYRSQVEKLTLLLFSLKIPVPKIGSVEEFQGQERLAIILSTVRGSNKCSKNDDVRSTLGFLANPRRINVAITRARALLIIIGNAFSLSIDPYWFSVIQYCVCNNSFVGSLPNQFILNGK